MNGIISFAFAVILHELGHITAAKLLGIRKISFIPCGLGAVLTFDFSGCGYIRESVVHLSGGIMGLVTAAAGYIIFGDRAVLFCGISVLLAVLNWLPIEGLDGSASMKAILSIRLMPDTVCRIAAVISSITTVLLWIAVLWIELRIRANFSCIILAIALLVPLADKKKQNRR